MPRKRLTRDRRDAGSHRNLGQIGSWPVFADWGDRSDDRRGTGPSAQACRAHGVLEILTAADGSERQIEAATTADCARSAWPVRGAEPS
jgi:hypothetical protein